MSKIIEYKKTLPCPCGSAKPYGVCCKKNGIIYGYNAQGSLVKKLPMNNEIKTEIQREIRKFKEYYGREPGGDDFLMSFLPVCNDEALLEIMSAMKAADIPPSRIYAYYKTDGLFPCSLNDDIMPEVDKREFAKYEQEYQEIMKRPITNTVPAMQYVALANDLLMDGLSVHEMLIDSLNDLIHRHSVRSDNSNQAVKQTELDFLIFSALKTIKTLKGIINLAQRHLPECITSLGRSLFENYLYLNKLNCDQSFFERKLLPKADRVNHKYVIRSNGKPDFNTVQNIQTGEQFNIHVKIADLRNAFTNQEDLDLYELFYVDACQYVHVDLSSAQNYFYSFNPYDEIDPSLCAVTTSLGISLLVYNELAGNRHIQPQFRKDATYLTKQIAKKLESSFQLLDGDVHHRKEIYGVLIARMNKLIAAHT